MGATINTDLCGILGTYEEEKANSSKFKNDGYETFHMLIRYSIPENS